MFQQITSGLYIHIGDIGNNSCLAGFDLGSTLIKTNKSKFIGATWQWEFLLNSLSVLKYYRDHGYTLVIFSNQNYYEDDLSFAMIRNHNVITSLMSLNINPWFLISTQQDIYRKPNTGMWDIFTYYYNNPINKEMSFFTGDSAARLEDNTSNDIDFARNIGINFYTPEEVFSR